MELSDLALAALINIFFNPLVQIAAQQQ